MALIVRVTALVVRTAIQELAWPRSRSLVAKSVDQLPATSTEVRIDGEPAVGALARSGVAAPLGTLLEGFASSAANWRMMIRSRSMSSTSCASSGLVGSTTRLVRPYTWNHRWVALLSENHRLTAVEVDEFIDSEMPNALFCINRLEIIESQREATAEVDGWILDLGIYKGAGTHALARIFPGASIHGFDSFEGLPVDWSHAMRRVRRHRAEAASGARQRHAPQGQVG